MPMVNIEISPNIEKKILKLSKKIDRDLDVLLKELLIRGLEEFYEDIEDIKAVEQYIADGGRNQKVYSMEEVLRELGLDELDMGVKRASSKAATQNAKVSSARNPQKTRPGNKK